MHVIVSIVLQYGMNKQHKLTSDVTQLRIYREIPMYTLYPMTIVSIVLRYVVSKQ